MNDNHKPDNSGALIGMTLTAISGAFVGFLIGLLF